MCCVVSHRLFCQIGNVVQLVFRLSGLSSDRSFLLLEQRGAENKGRRGRGSWP